MTARESIHAKLKYLNHPPRAARRAISSHSALALGAQGVIHLLLAAVLTNAIVMEDRAPFGVALVAASGSGLLGGSALLGACFGYLSMADFSAALRYCAAVILVFAVSFDVLLEASFLLDLYALPEETLSSTIV